MTTLVETDVKVKKYSELLLIEHLFIGILLHPNQGLPLQKVKIVSVVIGVGDHQANIPFIGCMRLRISVSGRFMGMIGQYPSVSKSNWLHVDLFRFFFIKLGYIK